MFKLASNRKVKFYANHRNTFGLMWGRPENGGTCPGATSGAGGCLSCVGKRTLPTCYMARICSTYPTVQDTLKYNTAQVRYMVYPAILEVIRNTLQEFVKRDKGRAPYFRIHYSGDFCSEPYAKAWATAIREYPDIKFWVYTRSLDWVKLFAGIKNISVFISCDPINKDAAFAKFEELKQYTNIGIAWMGNEAPSELRWVKCPEVTGILKNTKECGACSKCRLCIDRYKTRLKNIQFNIH